MSTFDWESFLKRWSQELLESISNDRNKLPPEVIESGWLGYPGATEEQIVRAETRLGTILPPSYRAFLKVTNGWRQTTPFISRLWSTEEIDWFTVRHQNWLDALLTKMGHPSAVSPNSSAPFSSIPDEEYFVYGDEQDCRKIRVEYLQTALDISQRGEAAIYLLNPQVVTEAGEWEAWFLGDWLPGADRYRSFQDMMQAEYESFLELRETPDASTLKVAIENVGYLPTAPDTVFKSAVILSAKTESLSEEVLIRETFPENKIHPDLETVNEWGKFASFIVEIQYRQKEKDSERRTVVQHLEAGTVATYPDIDTEKTQRWMLEQLKILTNNSLTNQFLEEPAGIKITQLRIIFSRFENPMVANLSHPLFSDVIAIGEPFTLEASMNVVGLTIINLAEQQLIYRAQCFAYNLSTHFKTCLGDIIANAPIGDQTAYTVLFPEITLQQPGIYRLKVWVTLQNTSASPGYFKVPMLRAV